MKRFYMIFLILLPAFLFADVPNEILGTWVSDPSNPYLTKIVILNGMIQINSGNAIIKYFGRVEKHENNYDLTFWNAGSMGNLKFVLINRNIIIYSWVDLMYKQMLGSEIEPIFRTILTGDNLVTLVKE